MNQLAEAARDELLLSAQRRNPDFIGGMLFNKRFKNVENDEVIGRPLFA